MMVLILIIGYFFGAFIQTSYLIGRIKKIDIRSYGSGNAGTTNAFRVMGKKVGIITAVVDVGKVFLADWITWMIFTNTGMPTMLIFLYCGLGVLVGHVFPFHMNFRGGKGVATMCGIIISFFFLPDNCFIMTLIGTAIFFGIAVKTRYISLASLSLAASFLIEFIIWVSVGATQLHGGDIPQGIIIVCIITAIVFVKHRGNIKRLINGNERRFGDREKINGESDK